MKTLKRSTFIWLALLSVNTAHAMSIKAPDLAENGAVIPVEIRPDNPLTAGQHLELLVNGQLAAQVRVVEGKLSLFSTRVKGNQKPTIITARAIANGREIDSTSKEVKITILASVEGSPTSVTSQKMRAQSGDIKVLMNSENGFAGTLVLQDAGFRVEISGTSVISKNPYINVKGEFSDQVTASINGQTPQPVAMPNVKPIPAATTPVKSTIPPVVIPARLTQEQIAAGAEAKRQEALKAIEREKDRGIAAQEQLERDAYDAKKKGNSEKAFRASLKKLNARELFALADKKRTAGELDKAREILRTLITKFPNNPLVEISVQQMSQLPAAPEDAATTNQPPAPTQTQSPSRDAGLEEMSGAFGSPRK